MTETLLGFGLACLGASLVEYWLHRALHFHYFCRSWLGRMHLRHHQEGRRQPLFRELTDYLPIAGLFAPVGLLGGWNFCIGWWLGSVGYALLVSALHNYAHATGGRFHEGHHGCPQYNYGVVTSFWDWAFGTYRAPEALARPYCSPEDRFGA